MTAAFTSVDHHLLEILSPTDFHGILFSWFISYFTDHFSASFAALPSLTQPVNGVLQGSILGFLFFSLFTLSLDDPIHLFPNVYLKFSPLLYIQFPLPCRYLLINCPHWSGMAIPPKLAPPPKPYPLTANICRVVHVEHRESCLTSSSPVQTFTKSCWFYLQNISQIHLSLHLCNHYQSPGLHHLLLLDYKPHIHSCPPVSLPSFRPSTGFPFLLG